jgi:hypothetical protein
MHMLVDRTYSKVSVQKLQSVAYMQDNLFLFTELRKYMK